MEKFTEFTSTENTSGSSIISNNCKALRIMYGETMTELAEALYCSPSAISMYESGAREPNFETIKRYCNHYSVVLNDFLTIKLPIVRLSYEEVNRKTSIHFFHKTFPVLLPPDVEKHNYFLNACKDYLAFWEPLCEPVPPCNDNQILNSLGSALENFRQAIIHHQHPLAAAVNYCSLLFRIYHITGNCLASNGSLPIVNSAKISRPDFIKKHMAQINYNFYFQTHTEVQEVIIREYSKMLGALIRMLQANAEPFREIGDFFDCYRYMIGFLPSGKSSPSQTELGLNMLCDLIDRSNRFAGSYVKLSRTMLGMEK